jgi:hypothetical protein
MSVDLEPQILKRLVQELAWRISNHSRNAPTVQGEPAW